MNSNPLERVVQAVVIANPEERPTLAQMLGEQAIGTFDYDLNGFICTAKLANLELLMLQYPQHPFSELEEGNHA